MEEKLLTVQDLCVSYGDGDVLSGVTFSMRAGEILCIAGESGCGKSTLLKAILGLEPLGAVVTGGHITFAGRELHAPVPRRLLGAEIGMIFQNPGASFNPVRSYEKQFRETLRSHGRAYDAQAVLDCLETLRLPDGARILKSCPYEMSGGMNQRIAIALAMLLRPRLLLCDEATGALDVTTQKAVVEELLRLRGECGTAILFVTHNLGVAARMADTVGVMYAGRMVESGDAAAVLQSPAHPYTQSLIAAVPDFGGALPKGLPGQPPLHGAETPGCAFAPRCPHAQPGCGKKAYTMRQVGARHFACCTGRV